MAGDGIGEFDLESVEIGVLRHLLESFASVGDVSVVLRHSLEELVLEKKNLLWCIGVEGIEKDACIDIAVVVEESEREVGEA